MSANYTQCNVRTTKGKQRSFEEDLRSAVGDIIYAELQSNGVLTYRKLGDARKYTAEEAVKYLTPAIL